jgi:hypothetical protein
MAAPAPASLLQQIQKDTICQPGKFDVVVTSYEMVIKVGGPEMFLGNFAATFQRVCLELVAR